MGYEIKLICTVVPNPYHKAYHSSANDYYYFSVFITPRLQFDGKLKEFYHMLKWPEYWPAIKNAMVLSALNQAGEESSNKMTIEADPSLAEPQLAGKGALLWQKLFNETTPVTAWPVFLRPVSYDWSKDDPQKAKHPSIASEVSALMATGISRAASIQRVNDQLNNPRSTLSKKLEEEKKQKTQQLLEAMKLEDQEFHKKVSALGHYPHILRALGLIWDFRVKKNTLTNVMDRLRILFPPQFPNQELVKSIQFIAPFTKTTHGERLHAFARPAYQDIVQNGFIKAADPLPNSPGFVVDMTYVENQASAGESAAAVSILGKENLQVVQEKSQDNVSKGISIKVREQGAELLTTMQHDFEKMTNENIGNGQFYFEAHQLDCGYRVDVSPGQNDEKKWYSLCKRKASYYIDKPGTTRETNILKDVQDEPWLEEVRQATSDGSAPVRFEEIARWNNWSLTCPKIQDNYKADTENRKNNEFNDLELRDIYPIDLPKLRFGQHYYFRIRIVDICGNGPDLHSTEGTEQLYSFTYIRKESLEDPLLFPNTKYYRIIEKELLEDGQPKLRNVMETLPAYKGETPAVMVVRSQVSPNGIVTPIDNDKVRYLTPAFVPVYFAEVSGLLEDTRGHFYETADLYNILDHEPRPYYRDNDINKAVPFFVDPIVTQIKVGTLAPEPVASAVAGAGSVHSRLRKPIKLSIIQQNKYYQFSINDKPQSSINLSPGSYHTLPITAQAANNTFLQKGEKQLKLIHAIQRPVCSNNIIQNNQIDLSLFFYLTKPSLDKNSPYTLAYHVELRHCADKAQQFMQSVFPNDTVSEYKIIAEYIEYTLNEKAPKGYILQEKKIIQEQAFSNLNDDTPADDLDVLLNQGDDKVTVKEFAKVHSFPHSFPDTRFHRVNYTIEAVSKFAGFFDTKAHKIKDDRHPYSVLGVLRDQPIVNSAKPSKPIVTSIIPIFGEKKRSGADNIIDVENRTFRIYLGKRWYETGLEEKIAVIHEEKVNSYRRYIDDAGEELAPPVSDSIYTRNKISIFANDPIDSVSTGQEVANDSLNSFLGDSNILHDSYQHNNETLKANFLLLDRTHLHDPIINTNIKKHRFSVYEVEWDLQQQEFYVDVTLHEAALKAYDYLLKLSICRYQEHSLMKENHYDYRFSDAVMTDMVPVWAKRSLNLTQHHLTRSMQGYRRTNGGMLSNTVYLVCTNSSLHDAVENVYTGDRSRPAEAFVEPVKETVTAHGSVYDFAAYRELAPKYHSIFVEEYENIENAPDPNLFERADLNPRNDPGKRLVFFYKLK